MKASQPDVRTLGVDLASDPKKTGVCVLDWHGGRAKVKELFVDADDAQIVKLERECSAAGIDAPFGWPRPFREFLTRASGSSLPSWQRKYRDRLLFRATDHHVKGIMKRWPLSVSSDRIGVTALRCAGLLSRLGVIDLSGSKGIFEVYPAAALHHWGLPCRKYKKKDGRGVRDRILIGLQGSAPWLKLSGEDLDLMRQTDDALDALICALVARAAALGLTNGPSESDTELAREEGWIHVPVPNALERLGEEQEAR